MIYIYIYTFIIYTNKTQCFAQQTWGGFYTPATEVTMCSFWQTIGCRIPEGFSADEMLAKGRVPSFWTLKNPKWPMINEGHDQSEKKPGFPGWQPRQRLCQFLGDGHQLSSIQECGCCYSWWIPHIVDSSNLICCVVSIYGPTTCWTGWEGITPLHWWDFPPGTPNPVIWRRDHSPRLTMIFHIWYPLVN